MEQQNIFKALSDPTRREILRRLRAGSMSAGDIAAQFDITRASLSHHFNVLKAAELVRSERRGQQIYYSLNTSVFEDVAALMFDLFGRAGD
ncbi:autorepressor SdpR family transcription factor [Microbulbifer sp. SAOS-129_SWC]|uniref:autorepressor SdpR family transcription factor n=1 Tax=Microbulbifer sp. SAOS-129_SWC TaxID=3145235 RepID=UPI00321716E5